ncbi:phage tail tape measure protein [Lacrimispora saccharolytica]|nr:phage tail tape measure protein [Lacrimispora saccharolytica]
MGQKLLPVTGVVTGLGTAAVKTAADFDSAMSKVAAVSGATGSDFDSLRDKAREMGAKTKFSATEAADSGHFADVLAAASSNANTNVSMMGETFKYCAPVAGALGFSVEDTAEAIGLMGNAGIEAFQAGTSMRFIMTNLTGM